MASAWFPYSEPVIDLNAKWRRLKRFKVSAEIGVAICAVELQRVEVCILQEPSFIRIAFSDNIYKQAQQTFAR